MSLFQPTYNDKKTGERKTSDVWWCEFSFAGKRYRESTKTTRKTLATDFEKRRRLELERQYAGVAVEQPVKTRIRTVIEAMKAYKTAYGVTHREKSSSSCLVRWVNRL